MTSWQQLGSILENNVHQNYKHQKEALTKVVVLNHYFQKAFIYAILWSKNDFEIQNLQYFKCSSLCWAKSLNPAGGNIIAQLTFTLKYCLVFFNFFIFHIVSEKNEHSVRFDSYSSHIFIKIWCSGLQFWQLQR